MLTEEQLKLRRKGIGGSDVAAIYGISRYKTAFRVYQEKMGYALPQEMTEAQRHGHIMEPIILNEYQNKTGYNLHRSPPTIFSQEYPWMLANLDAYDSEGYIIDAKYFHWSRKKEFGEPGTSEMPHDILLQMVHYAIVCNAEKVDVAVFFDRPELFVYTYERDEELEHDVIETERHFWHEHYLKGIPPEVETPEDINIRWPKSKPLTIKTASNNALNAYEKLKSLKLHKKDIESEQAELEGIIKSEIQDFEELIDHSGNKLATWKTQVSNRLDQKKLQAEYPHVYSQYLKQSETRVFLLK
jgi:putative phage-type endonuclease